MSSWKKKQSDQHENRNMEAGQNNKNMHTKVEYNSKNFYMVTHNHTQRQNTKCIWILETFFLFLAAASLHCSVSTVMRWSRSEGGFPVKNPLYFDYSERLLQPVINSLVSMHFNRRLLWIATITPCALISNNYQRCLQNRKGQKKMI